MAPVMLLKSRREHSAASADSADDIFRSSDAKSMKPHQQINHTVTVTTTSSVLAAAPSLTPSSKVFNDYNWDVVDEYDPLWPNEYEKIMGERRDKDMEKQREQRNASGAAAGNASSMINKHHHHHHHHRKSSRFNENDSPPAAGKYAGFGGAPAATDEEERRSPPSQTAQSRTGGAAIAPPLSLQENTQMTTFSQDGKSSNVSAPYGTSSVAAKIMAKYGFKVSDTYIVKKTKIKILLVSVKKKDGRGLGKQEQGMSIALQVEKTSKRGGRIIHEKELMMPPSSVSTPPHGGNGSSGSSSTAAAISNSSLPPVIAAPPVQALVAPTVQPPAPSPASLPPPPSPLPSPIAPVAAAAAAAVATKPQEEPTITEIMKAPSKVVLLRNMVGPGDVDNDLEPEVKDECNTKYGDVVSVVINELKNVVPEEAVRIFVEFKRIESAIKGKLKRKKRFVFFYGKIKIY